MRFKVGDKVKVKSLEWYNNVDKENVDFVQEMVKYCGMIGVITSITMDERAYRISFNGNDTGWFWSDYMLEDIIHEPCEYCRDESRRALLSDEKYNESFVEVAGGELVMVTDDVYSIAINFCPMCGIKLKQRLIMERKIGEVFTIDGKQYEVCKTNKKGLPSCSDCDLRYCCCGDKWYEYIGECIGDEREDNRDVVFKELVPNIKTFK